MAEITNVSKLIINYLTEEQYQTAKASGLINENELYIESAQTLLGVAHPTSHPPSIITQDASNRFVTDTEKRRGCKANPPPTAVTATLSTTWTGSGSLHAKRHRLGRYFDQQHHCFIGFNGERSSKKCGEGCLAFSDGTGDKQHHGHG